MLFGFDLLRDVLLSQGDLNYRRPNKRGGYGPSIRKIIYMTLMEPLFKIGKPPEDVHWGVPYRFHTELYEFFEQGVSEEIDEIWNQVKRDYAVA